MNIPLPYLAAGIVCFIMISTATIVPRRWIFDWKFSHILWHGKTSNTDIAFTFDDGPHPINTPILLDILRNNRVKATFFIVGERAEKNPQLISRMHEEGHLVGNHSYSHLKFPFHTSIEMKKEIIRTNALIEKHTGVRTHYFRPPHGLRDFRLWHILRHLQMIGVMWTIMPWDWKNISEKRIVQKILNSIHNGAIITLHDGGGEREETLKAVEKLIPLLRQKGFHFTTVDRMIE
jgi:peptidoglycan/xylan/chitin deacetylase (PgdA/CDA1 family)